MQTQKAEQPPPAMGTPQRRYDIDWLRVLVMLAVFFFHCARFFGGGTWHLNNAEESLVAGLFIGWLDMWFMPLFFLLSGVGSWYSLRSRSNGQYLLERVKRLLVPLYTVGLFVINPPAYYFDSFSNSGCRGTFWEILPRYFSEWPVYLMPVVPYPGHLWFLQFLFMISLWSLLLPRYLLTERGLHLIDTLAGWCHRRGGIFLFLIPVIFVRVSLHSFFSGVYTEADFFEFLVFFVIGYILAADTRFTESIKKHGWFCLILGLVSYVGIFYFNVELGYWGGKPFSLIFVLFQIVYGIGRWSWIVFVLSLGAKYLKNVNNKGLAYSSEAVLPFYILHHTIILCVGWFVIRWNIGILPKFLIIVIASFALIMVLYELLVKPFNVGRFLFGMRPKKKPSATPVPRPGETAA
jgi:surface polysaccharide O-acyltransferase-like enzyme